jgi:ribosome-associated translation inhibitor RaiA
METEIRIRGARSQRVEVAMVCRAAWPLLCCDYDAVRNQSASLLLLPANTPTGANMKTSISYKHVDSREEVEKQSERHVGKLSKLLKTYEPDLVQLHGVFTKNSHNGDYSFSLNLSLPTGTLHATGVGEAVGVSCKKAFAELESQVKKHQQRLRKDYEWKRKRPRARAIET